MNLSYTSQNVNMDALNYFADSAGNHNGIVSRIEKEHMEDKFNLAEADSNGVKHLYIITTSDLQNYVAHIEEENGLYISEEELKKENAGVIVKGTIGIIKFNELGEITAAYTGWGNFTTNTWAEESVMPIIAYNPIMNARRTF